MATNDFFKKEVERAERVLTSKGKRITAGRVIAELSLGFWNSLFETHHYALLKGVPCTIFKSLPSGYGRKDVNAIIQRIRNLRNRVSHNEPLCFCDKKFDMTYSKEMYRSICDFLSWIDDGIMRTLGDKGLDRVQEEIDKAEKLILS